MLSPRPGATSRLAGRIEQSRQRADDPAPARRGGGGVCRRAVELAPDQAEYRNNLGLVLHEAGRLQAALACFDQAIALNPSYAEAYNNRGNLYRDQVRLAKKSLASYERAVALRPGYVHADSNALLVLAYGKLVPPDELARRAHLWYERHAPGPLPRRPSIPGKRDPERRLRIGFVSPDFHAHPVAMFMEPVFRALSRGVLRARVERSPMPISRSRTRPARGCKS